MDKLPFEIKYNEKELKKLLEEKGTGEVYKMMKVAAVDLLIKVQEKKHD